MSTALRARVCLFEAFKVSDGKIQQFEATMRNLDCGAKIDWPRSSTSTQRT